MTTKMDSHGTATVAIRSMVTTNKCLGIPLLYDDSLRTISESRGLWRWKKIFVGPALLAFPPREQQAIVLHEAGHCKLNHIEKRILALWRIFRPSLLALLCIEQEFEADRFVKGCGYGQDLAHAFMRLSPTSDPLHPPLEERISRLLS